jgi:hypothetical protein
VNEDDLQDRLRRISAAPFADRDELLRQLGRDINPALKDKIRSWKQKGWLLWGAFEGVLSSALERNDISEDEKTEAVEEGYEVIAAIKTFSQAESGLVPRQMAFDLAMNALFAGLRAGFTPEEIRKLKAHWKFEDRREIGRKSEPRRKAKSQEWRARASDLAKAIWAKNNTLSQEDLADKIIHNWG